MVGFGWIWFDQVGLGWTRTGWTGLTSRTKSDTAFECRWARTSGANIGLVFHGFDFLL